MSFRWKYEHYLLEYVSSLLTLHYTVPFFHLYLTCSEQLLKLVTKVGVCPPSLEWLDQGRKSPQDHSSSSLEECGKELLLEVAERERERERL